MRIYKMKNNIRYALIEDDQQYYVFDMYEHKKGVIYFWQNINYKFTTYQITEDEFNQLVKAKITEKSAFETFLVIPLLAISLSKYLSHGIQNNNLVMQIKGAQIINILCLIGIPLITGYLIYRLNYLQINKPKNNFKIQMIHDENTRNKIIVKAIVYIVILYFCLGVIINNLNMINIPLLCITLFIVSMYILFPAVTIYDVKSIDKYYYKGEKSSS